MTHRFLFQFCSVYDPATVSLELAASLLRLTARRRKLDTNLTTEPCYRHCAAAFFLSIYILTFKITARCKDLLSDVMTSCLFCLSILCIFLDNNLQFPQFSLKKKLYPFCIICLLNILKRTEYYGKFASKTLT